LGTYRSKIGVAVDGRLYLEQVMGDGRESLSGVGRTGAWEWFADTREVKALTPEGLSARKWNALHLFALQPEAVLSSPGATRTTEFDGQAAHTVTFKDRMDSTVVAFYRSSDGALLGLRLQDHTGSGARRITVRVSEWRQDDGLNLFRKAVITQGDAVTRFHFAEVRVNAVPDSLFEPPGGATIPGVSGASVAGPPAVTAEGSGAAPLGAAAGIATGAALGATALSGSGSEEVPGATPIPTSAVEVSGLPSKSDSTDVNRLLELHGELLLAYRAADVDLLLRADSPDYVQISRGQITSPPTAERAARMGPYFERTRFHEFRDLAAPIVKVSSEGTLGWVIAQVHAAGVMSTDEEPGEQLVEFTSAWVELYEKRSGNWVRVGNASSPQRPTR
jgi:hypothetical protein